MVLLQTCLECEKMGAGHGPKLWFSVDCIGKTMIHHDPSSNLRDRI